MPSNSLAVCRASEGAAVPCSLHAFLVCCAAPSALNDDAHPDPGLTAGPIHFRPFGPTLVELQIPGGNQTVPVEPPDVAIGSQPGAKRRQ